MKHEDILIDLLKVLTDNNSRAVILQGFIQEYGPLSESAGEQVRELLGAGRADKFEWRKVPRHGIEECYMPGNDTMLAWLTPRPAYCDRGHWQVNGNLSDIDPADGFPRYYMRKEVAVAETEAWLRWRMFGIRAERPFTQPLETDDAT